MNTSSTPSGISEGIVLQQLTPSDVHLLQELCIQTFRETFAAYNTEEDMKTYIHTSFSIEKLTVELAHPQSEFYLARQSQTDIGYLKLNFGTAQTEQQDPRAVEIERIYVRSEFHGKQVGQLLYEKAFERAQQDAAPYLWLGVWEQNPKAIRFYEKNGFVPFGTHVFRLGNDEQTDILMKRPLSHP